MATVRAVCVIAGLILVSLFVIPTQWVIVKLGLSTKPHIPLLWHKAVCWLVGLRVHQNGKMATERPLLITANHCSWLDISALGSTNLVCFIAKSEVNEWPVFGFLSRLQRTIFVNRKRKTDIGRVAKEVANRMAGGEAMVLFAEGTSSNGNEVLPFRSALIGAAHQAMHVGEEEAAYVQPLSIAYTRLHGMPMGHFWRKHVAWYGDMELAGHLWAILKEGGLDVELTWGTPVPIEKATDRKALTRDLHEQVRVMTLVALHGDRSKQKELAES